MKRLEALQCGMRVGGIVPQQIVKLIDLEWRGAEALAVVYEDESGGIGRALLRRQDESGLQAVPAQRRDFGADGSAFRLVSEAYRMRLAHLFDPMMAVHTALIDPLPHQIKAVYDEMLPRQPLRFLLADDPGAGKTIMAGLLMRELMVRDNLRRCLVCAPGNLTEQWRDELWTKFRLDFTVMTGERLAAPGGNPFNAADRIIIRLDQISRSEKWQAQLAQSEWDLIVCDEAHKMSASLAGSKVKETKRYRLGRLLSGLTRHFLLMTATPHNGKEDDFQLFMQLLDADRFAGGRSGLSQGDNADMMRRMVKENLLKLDGSPLFPARRAYTINYELSPQEADLYAGVTEYIRRQFSRADKLEGRRRNSIGFALTILQRRLASSPAAIHKSLKRRRASLQERLKAAEARSDYALPDALPHREEGWDDWDDVEEAPEAEVEKIAGELLDHASAARSVDELRSEIKSLAALERQAGRIRHSGSDRKWNELRRLLHDRPEMKNADGTQRKLVIFTEHRDTLTYLIEKLNTLIGRDGAVLTIHGGISRAVRRQAEARFRDDPTALILVATDAAGEGINLQRAHLMVNYDLPWNPNRLEQRFGRIHRIGQTEVCHLWNLVAAETREGAVFKRLLEKLETERNALNGQVFDVLGQLFQERPLHSLLVEAVREGDGQRARAVLERTVDDLVAAGQHRASESRLSTRAPMDAGDARRIRGDMDAAAARRLQPYFIKAFFLRAFERLGGKAHRREKGRYAINRVPADIRRSANGRIAEKYERICFDKHRIHHPTKPEAAFVCLGHPLLEATIDRLLECERATLQRGAVLIDDGDPGTALRVLFYLEQTIQDALPSQNPAGNIISRELHFVEIDSAGDVHRAGSAPYLDYRPAADDELAAIHPHRQSGWLQGDALEQRALEYAAAHLFPPHLERVRQARLALIDRSRAAVAERLTKEIGYWDGQAAALRAAEKEGRHNARQRRQRAEERADALHKRLQQRQRQFEREGQIRAGCPVLRSAALVVPRGLLLGEKPDAPPLDRRIVEALAMQAVMRAEIELGNAPVDVSAEKCGYDIYSRDAEGQSRFIEVKGRRAGAGTVTLTHNELRTAVNAPQQFILALVEVDGQTARPPRYLRAFPFDEPGLHLVSSSFKLRDLLELCTEPC